MKYISIDIETTGLSPKNDQILEVAMIIEDISMVLPREECPTFHKYIDHHRYEGDPKALAMNSKTFEAIDELRKKPSNTLIKEADLLPEILAFLYANKVSTEDKIMVAGANFLGFDNNFFKKVFDRNDSLYYDKKPRSKDFYDLIERRSVDPSHYFINFMNDKRLPTLEECKARAGIPGGVKHNALDDAWDVIEILRTKYASI